MHMLPANHARDGKHPPPAPCNGRLLPSFSTLTGCMHTRTQAGIDVSDDELPLHLGGQASKRSKRGKGGSSNGAAHEEDQRVLAQARKVAQEVRAGLLRLLRLLFSAW